MNMANGKDKIIGNFSNEEMSKINSQLFNYQGSDLFDINNRESEEDIIGIDDDEITLFFHESEKKAEKICKNILFAYSIKMNKKNNCDMKNLNLTSAELNSVTNRFNELNNSFVSELSLKDNLVKYYLSNVSSATEEEAIEFVTRMMGGVEELTSKFRQALEMGWDPTQEIVSITNDMSIEQRYDFLVNAIILVQQLNLENLTESKDLKTEIEESINALKNKLEEPTEEICNILQNELSTLLCNSTLMVAGAEEVDKIMDVASKTSIEVVDFASNQYDDICHKCKMTMATWIEYKEGNLPSIPEGIMIETLAVSIASGVEEARIISEVTSGNKTIDWAAKCLKILGGIALMCFLGYIAILGLALTAGAFLEAGLLVFGTSYVAIVASSIIALLVCWGLSDTILNEVSKVIEWTGRLYDKIVSTVKRTVVPIIQETARRVVNGVKNLLFKISNALA